MPPPPPPCLLRVGGPLGPVYLCEYGCGKNADVAVHFEITHHDETNRVIHVHPCDMDQCPAKQRQQLDIDALLTDYRVEIHVMCRVRYDNSSAYIDSLERGAHVIVDNYSPKQHRLVELVTERVLRSPIAENVKQQSLKSNRTRCRYVSLYEVTDNVAYLLDRQTGCLFADVNNDDYDTTVSDVLSGGGGGSSRLFVNVVEVSTAR